MFISKISRQLFCTVLQLCFNLNFLKIGLLEREENFQKVLECTLPLHNLKASILNLGLIWCVLFDTVTTPPQHEVFVILCDDMIILMSAQMKISCG